MKTGEPIICTGGLNKRYTKWEAKVLKGAKLIKRNSKRMFSIIAKSENSRSWRGAF